MQKASRPFYFFTRVLFSHETDIYTKQKHTASDSNRAQTLQLPQITISDNFFSHYCYFFSIKLSPQDHKHSPPCSLLLKHTPSGAKTLTWRDFRAKTRTNQMTQAARVQWQGRETSVLCWFDFCKDAFHEAIRVISDVYNSHSPVTENHFAAFILQVLLFKRSEKQYPPPPPWEMVSSEMLAATTETGHVTSQTAGCFIECGQKDRLE